MEQHSITAEELHSVLASDQEVLLFDVRQPLDLLAYPEMIPQAQRIAPNEVLARPTLIPKKKTRWFTVPVRARKPAARCCVARWR
jgi:rhodanese-related sulfurtransferase